MGLYEVGEDVAVWRICTRCGAHEDDIRAEREGLRPRGDCWHGSTTDICDDEDCEACNHDPDLWRLGLRERPEDAWDDDEDDE